VTLKSPQSDLPRALSGAADLWDVEQGGVLLTAEFFAAADITLAGNNAEQTNTATSGAVTQTHILAGVSASQQATATSGAVVQTHKLSGRSSSQANSSTSGAITTNSVTVYLSGVSVSSAARSTVWAVSQNHILSGIGVVQVNISKYAGGRLAPGYLSAQAAKRCDLQASTILKNSLNAQSSKLATLTIEVTNHV